MSHKSRYEYEAEERDRQEARMGVYLILFLAFLWALGLVRDALGSEPAFTVTNHCPPTFTVDNKIPAGPGKTPPGPGSPTTIDPGAVSGHSYIYQNEYHPQLGGWVLVRRVACSTPMHRDVTTDLLRSDRGVYHPIPAPGVAGGTFRGGYHSSHRCPNPNCRYESPGGTGTWVVRGHNPDGTHNHTCPQCLTTWKH